MRIASPPYLTRRTDILPKIRDKISRLESCQSSRTATEFYNTVIKTFEEIGITPRRSFFWDNGYSLIFAENRDPTTQERIAIVAKTNKIITAHYLVLDMTNEIKIKKQISTETSLASRIPGLASDIYLGRISASTQMPTQVSINGIAYPIKYRDKIGFLTN